MDDYVWDGPPMGHGTTPNKWVEGHVEIAPQGQSEVHLELVDMVNHPPHYANHKHEPIDVIEDWGLNFCLGNAVKYIARAGKKTPDPIEDLRKAEFYLKRAIQEIDGHARPN